MRRRALLLALTIVAVAAAGCGGEPAGDPATGEPTAPTEGTTTAAATGPGPTTPAGQDTTTPAAAELPDTPQGRLGQTATIGQLPELPTADGGVEVVAMGPPSQSSVPVVVHNATAGPVSRVAVSGAVVDGDGSTLASGSSQGFLPPVVEAGGHTFGYVFADTTEQLPDDAALDNPAVDFNEGLDDFENIAALDVVSVELTGDGATGEVANPNDVEVSGPVSVYLACFDADGQLTAVQSGFADRDRVPAGETSTFTLPLFGQSCDAAVAAASGYVEMTG